MHVGLYTKLIRINLRVNMEEYSGYRKIQKTFEALPTSQMPHVPNYFPNDMISLITVPLIYILHHSPPTN
jgi:hypothetical protein